ncbi:MAG: hypothetical protein ACK4TC_05650 [Sphingomonas pseudosanguinis]|uniref:hypothetical protein n=1 Tax=Sphingomonas pseudosanguinis TaxID=413712 RepID=UPI003919922E
MLHFALPSTAACTPLTPDAYLQLRRQAAGLSRDDVARRIATSAQDVSIAGTLVRSLETPGVRARLRATLDRLRTAFPFDQDVYHQLHHAPASSHPRICRGCGVSAWDMETAPGVDAGGWHDDATCMGCATLAGNR